MFGLPRLYFAVYRLKSKAILINIIKTWLPTVRPVFKVVLGIERHSACMMKQISMPKMSADLSIHGSNALGGSYLHSDLAEETQKHMILEEDNLPR